MPVHASAEALSPPKPRCCPNTPERKIEVLELSKDERAALRKATAKVADALIAKNAFPREWYDRVQKALANFRAGK